jgi:2-aminoadipate transaminase
MGVETTTERASLARRATHLMTSRTAPEPADIISLGSGHGFPGVFPDLTEMAQRALTSYRSETLQYGPALGLPEMREWIAGHMTQNGLTVSADNILVVNGAKHGLDLICRLLLDEGDAVVVTSPTYFTCIPIFRSFGVEFIEISQDSEGLVVGELSETLERRKLLGQSPPKLIYDVPDYHNPAGVTMSSRRREALVQVADANGIYIVEDSPYRQVRFDGEQEPMVKAFDRGDTVFSLGTFSKLVAPGLRIGWVVTSKEMVARLMQLKSDAGSCPLTQRIIVEFCKGGHLTAHTKRVQDTYREHRDTMVTALRHNLPEVSFQVPRGGYYLWLTLPPDVDCDKLAEHALHEKVGIISGSKFFAGKGPRGEGAPRHHVRLCYSHATPREIKAAVERLARALRSMNH